MKKIIAGNHALGNHGHDHDPMTKPAYRKSSTSEVKKDFIKTQQYYETLFKNNKDTFPGFSSARLPGDGRTFDSFKKMITDELYLPHVGWNFEFSLNGILANTLQLYDWEDLRKDEKKKAVKYGGVSAPKNLKLRSGHIVLLHEHHWTTDASIKLFDRLIKHLKKKYIFKTLDPVPTGNASVLMPSQSALKKKVAEQKATKAAKRKPAMAR